MSNVTLYLEKAEETLIESELMLQHQLFAGSVSRAYYAAFYAMQAALESNQIEAKTHQGALLMFNKHFFKEGIFDKNIAKFIKENLDKRLLGD